MDPIPNLQQTANVSSDLDPLAPSPNIAPPVPTLDAYGGPPQLLQMPGDIGGVAQTLSVPTPGAGEMNAAYKVSPCHHSVPQSFVRVLPFRIDTVLCLTQVSKQLVRERMERENPEDIAILDAVKDTDIICVRGTYDHIHLVLEAIGIPFSHVHPQSLLKMELKPEQTIYINCPSSFPVEVAAKLRGFVEQGGQLITTDWALKHVLEKAFPGTVRYSGTSTGDEVVAIEIVEKDDDILRGSFSLSTFNT